MIYTLVMTVDVAELCILWRILSGSMWSTCRCTKRTLRVNLLVSLQTASSWLFHLSSTLLTWPF